jgi:hypothetical protein
MDSARHADVMGLTHTNIYERRKIKQNEMGLFVVNERTRRIAGYFWRQKDQDKCCCVQRGGGKGRQIQSNEKSKK